MSSLPDLRVVLLGKTGAGKSSLGNTLIGRKDFRVEVSFASVTFRCQWEAAVRFGVHLEVTDTPGVSDTDRQEPEVLREIAKSIAVASPGPHAVLMVLRCDRRFTQEEYEAYLTLKRLFGDNIRNHMIIVFAGADAFGESQAEREAELAKAIQTAPPTLKEVLDDAGGRYCSVDNKASREDREQQAQIIVKAIQDLVSSNGGRYFTSRLVEEVNERVETAAQHRLDAGLDRTHEDAVRDTRHNILEDRAEPGFFEGLMDLVRENLLPIVGTAIGAAASVAAQVAIKVAVSRCSVM